SSPSPTIPILAAEALRNSSPPAPDTAPPPTKHEERMPLFWRVFGGTLLSIAALVILTLCQHFNNSLNELRGELSTLNDRLRKDMGHINADLRKDLNHINETHGDLVRKEEFNSRLKSVWDSVKELRELQVTVSGLKERAMLRDQEVKTEAERKELVLELQRL